jgi:hypothetical protein
VVLKPVLQKFTVVESRLILIGAMMINPPFRGFTGSRACHPIKTRYILIKDRQFEFFCRERVMEKLLVILCIAFLIAGCTAQKPHETEGAGGAGPAGPSEYEKKKGDVPGE